MRDVGGDVDLGAESEINFCPGMGNGGVDDRVLGLVGRSDVFFPCGLVVAGVHWVHLFSQHKVVINALANIMVIPVNFLGQKLWSFKK